MATPSISETQARPNASPVSPPVAAPVTELPAVVVEAPAPQTRAVPRTFLGTTATPGVDPRSALAPAGPGKPAKARAGVPEPSDVIRPQDDSVLGSVKRFMARPPVIAEAERKMRLFAAYGGLDALIAAYDPAAQQGYNRLLRQTANIRRPEQVALLEPRFRELKARLIDRARAAISSEQARVTATGGTFDRLAYLQAHGVVSRSWHMSGPSRAVRISNPDEDKDDERVARYNRRVTVEAELVLDTRLPVAAVDHSSGNMTVLRGEDYGSDVDLRKAESLVATRKAELATAVAAEQKLKDTITESQRDMDSARAQIEAARAAVVSATEKEKLAERELTRVKQLATDADRAAREADTQRTTAAARITGDLLRLDQGIDMSILFETASAELRPESMRQLKDLGAALRAESLRGLPIVVDGHTDAQGTPERNQLLSERRAAAVVSFLADKAGVPRDMLTSRGMGQRELKDPAHPLADANRRVHISVDISPQRRAELQAKAAEAQLQLEEHAAGLARASVDASQSVVDAADGYTKATKAVAKERASFEEGRRDFSAAGQRLVAAQKALPAAAKGITTARGNVSDATDLAARERPLAEGAFFVNDLHGVHWDWLDGHPEKLPERYAQALTDGLNHSAEGFVARDLLKRTNRATGNTLALDVGTLLAQNEDDKSRWTRFSDRMSLSWPDGRWVFVNGYSGRGQYLDGWQPVPPTLAPPREVAIPVEMSPPPTPPVPARTLDLDNAVATGPVTSQQAAADPQPDAGTPQPNAEPLPSASPTADPSAVADDAKALRDAALRRTEEARANLDRLRREAEGRRAAAANAPGPPAPARSTRIEIALSFDFDSAAITDISALRELGPQLLRDELKGQRIFIFGHTDDAGTPAHNMELSRRRAQAVSDFLIETFHIPAELLVVQGFGATRLKNPTDPRAPENRRVEVGVGAQK
jgi:outer membrane protein OmpA-like peptidoglycan-associated protein